MARRTTLVTITRAGRDFGKVFELTEVPADQGERWANRAILAIANAGAKLPEGALDNGMAGLALTWRNTLVAGLRSFAGLSWHDVAPLLDEMKPCVKFVPAGAPTERQIIFPGETSQIEEITTWYTLRYAIIELHVGFSLADALPTSELKEASPASSTT